MEFLQAFLPIVIYFLLIILIVVLIILGIKFLITVNKVEKIVDNVNDKLEAVSPIFNILGYASSQVTTVFDTVFEFIEGLLEKLFTKKNKIEMEEDEDE